MSGEPLLSSFHGQLARQFLLVQYTSRMAEKCAQLSEALQAGDGSALQVAFRAGTNDRSTEPSGAASRPRM